LTGHWKAKDRLTERGQARLAVIAAHVDPVREPRWVDFLIKIVASESLAVGQFAIGPLGAARDRRATKSLLKLLDGNTKGEKRLQFAATVVVALGKIGDPVAV